MGGRNVISHFLLKELERGVDPLGPDNKIIFAPGVLTGTNFPGSSRSSVGAKSPLTGCYGDAEGGGFWPAEFKKTGYDVIIVEGVSPSPCYISIMPDGVKIRDASAIWGKSTLEADEIIRGEVGKGVRILQTGSAGEKLVKYANVCHDLGHFAGRTGMGAVMGSKKLRAIVVKGHEKVGVASPDDLSAVMSGVSKELIEKAMSLHQYGTATVLKPLQESGGLPTRNFTLGQFDGADAIDAEALKKIMFKQKSCFACPVRCKPVVGFSEPYDVNEKYGGPEYETLGSLGSTCGVSDLKAICKANELCASYCMDTISAGVSIAFAMECFENGIITSADLDGMTLGFGDADGMVEMVRMIAERRAFGELLGEGVRVAAEKLGDAARPFAMHIKGLEIPMHEPRLKSGLGLGYAISPTGADHCHNFHDTVFVNSVGDWDAFGILEPMPAQQLDGAKVKMFQLVSNWRHFFNCAELCYFVPWTSRQVVDGMRAITGWNTSLMELWKVGERSLNLSRIFNIREGLSVQDDDLPERFGVPFKEGPTAGVEALTRTRSVLPLYYEMAGWTPEGVPTKGKIADLGIDWVLEYLEK